MKSAEPTITFVAPSASTSFARAGVRMPPPTRHGSAPQIRATSASLRPTPFRRVEIDQLHLGLAAQPLDPGVDVGGLDRQLLALHELDDAAALEIDRGISMRSP